MYGNVLDVEGDFVLVKNHDREVLFGGTNVSDVGIGDRLVVIYEYDQNYNIHVIDMEKD